MTEDHTFFPWVSALITGLLLALPHLYKCQSRVHCFLWKTVPPPTPPPKKRKKEKKIYMYCISGSLLGDRILLSQILEFQVTPAYFFFFFLFKTSRVCRHYSCSLSRFFNSPWHRHFDTQYFNCCRVIRLAVPLQQEMACETISRHLGRDISLRASSHVRLTMDHW